MADDVLRNQHQPPLPQQQAPLPLHNSVTDLNHPPAARQYAVAQMRRRTAAVRDMLMHASPYEIEVGKLYFIVLPMQV
eukprot:6191744-Pleurochrysis_carterae.AAC.2